MQNSSTTFKRQILLWVVCRTQFVMAFQQRRVKMQGKYYKKVVSMSLFEWSELSQMDDYLSHKMLCTPMCLLYIVDQVFQFANNFPFNILIQNLIYWIL